MCLESGHHHHHHHHHHHRHADASKYGTGGAPSQRHSMRFDIQRVHLDAVGGAAGDMFVAAMLDALPDLKDRVLSDVAAVLPAECGAPRLEAGISGGLTVLRFGLDPTQSQNVPRPSIQSHFSDMMKRIATATLHFGTAEHAISILTRLATAESLIHGVPVDEVHFHELADWDSLMDVIAAGSIAAALPETKWSVSDLPLGRGQVRTQHGLLPVPAPATAEILKGFRWRDDGIDGERVTPTGAAILAHLIDASAAPETRGGKLVACGMGAGTRELTGAPNILRALVFSIRASNEEAEDVIVLSFDIDDMTGEEIGIASDHLRATEGVLDLTVGGRLGKKNRPVSDFRLLVRPEHLPMLAEQCFLETSTIGLRWRREERACLPRSTESRKVDGESLRGKRVSRPDGQPSLKVESDDLAQFTNLMRRRRMKSLGECAEDED